MRLHDIIGGWSNNNICPRVVDVQCAEAINFVVGIGRCMVCHCPLPRDRGRVQGVVVLEFDYEMGRASGSA